MEGRSFGQRRPPLSVTIKSILDRYPDGQIFKEVIQNADDAKASTVKFFLDYRQHGTASVIDPALARFQGPALLVYNDATFSDDDWEGIQNLQRSIKADDPFKVGKFGIGFNSVYHITDCPSIVSGSYLAYLEPQEKIWRGESGKMFDIADIYHRGKTNALQPFQGICEFVAGITSFPGTIFRFPLRTTQSEISGNIYTVQQLRVLFDALQNEAKVMLLFLRSVLNVEVHEVNDSGITLLFGISIPEQEEIMHQRSQFMQDLSVSYTSQPNGINKMEQLLSEYHVEVLDQHGSEPEESHWLVLTQVGSSDHEVLRLAQVQKTLPWVGAALELHPPSTVRGGRIFCFLPMPVEASSPFPVHINGTFGLNDDRRTLKWSGPDRQNDPTAKWNEVLVTKLLSQCYVELLMNAQKHLSPQEFYMMWPEVNKAKDTPWKCLLQPFLQSLFCKKAIQTENDKWILPHNGIYISQGQTLPSVIQYALSNCNVQLVSIPPKVWAALQYSTASVTEVNPMFTRNRLRENKLSYSSIDRNGKLEILRYCLSDGDYSDLEGLCLLPLADKLNWADIVARYSPSSLAQHSQHFHYLCTVQCPAYLLPNQEHILVDVLGDEELQSGLMEVAKMGTTQLKELTAKDVAQLLSESFPREWQRQQIVSIPHFQFPMDWFELFWKWVGNNDLSSFAGQPLIPVRPAGSSSASFQVARLNKKGNILYIPGHDTSPQELFTALDNLRILYSKQLHFPYLAHAELSNYLITFNSNGILDAISRSSHNMELVKFSKKEAKSLKAFLVSPPPVLNTCRLQVLQNLKLFTTLANSRRKLYSVSECAASSLLKAAIKVPANFILQTDHLPSIALVFSDEHFQTQLLRQLQSKGLISAPNNATFLLTYIFPLIPTKLDHNVLTSIMEDVLDQLPLLKREGFSQIVLALTSLRFIKDKSGHYRSPSELFDPSIEQLVQLFKGESVFPDAHSPFSEERNLIHLRGCGLRQSVEPQEIIKIITSIALPCTVVPQQVDATKLSRAKAVLRYIAGCTLQQLQSNVTISDFQEASTFQSALRHLALDYSWFPVCSTQPEGYPQGLLWKGSFCNSHFVSLTDSTVILSTQNASSLPLIIGSQVYVVNTNPSSQTAKVFGMKASDRVIQVITHFKEVIGSAEHVPPQVMEGIIHKLYIYLNIARQAGLQSQLEELRSIPRWIWLKKQQRFLSINSVAVEGNETFGHKLEPYIFHLPDELSQYTELFVYFGMPQHVSSSQILSVLGAIRSTDQSILHPKRTWEVVMNILNWMTKYGEEEVSLPDGYTLYVPIQSDSATPVLQDANEVVYTDNDYLKDYLASVETEQSFTCAHERIYPKLAHCLGLSSLSDYLDITEDTFEDAGQYEPLTVRLKNILRDYKDGLTIIKELIQNADDAEATEVNICYDARTIQVNSKALFFPGMADAHGPALVVHNNAVFSKDDMENITKLAGATKQDKPLKIGKFGIGFCSVYHITDVPSFVSQETLCVFDPTLSYLRKEIKNPARPGKRMKFTTKLLTTSKQLAPYNGLFGFSQKCAYQGTLFRFPFRTHISELSSTIYSEVMINDLQSEIFENSSKLLLFLQNVKKITFSRINQGDQSPTTLFKVEKSLYMVPPQAIMCTIECLYSHESTTKENWLVATESRVKLKSATASVACQLIKHSSSNLELTQPVQGEAFCFLPLALKTGLPVHISANFAVMNNRRGIWTSDGGTRDNFEVKWNEELIHNIVPSAYYTLLLVLKKLAIQGMLLDYQFYSLWPLKAHQPWNMLIPAVYSYLQSSGLFYSSSVNKWLTVNKSTFIARDILTMSSSTSQTPSCILNAVKYFQLPIVNLEEEYKSYLDVTSSTVTEEKFVSLFFEKIDILTCDHFVSTRNDVLCLMLEIYAMELDSNTPRNKYLELHLRKNPCVPCVPDGNTLRLCSSVIDGNATFASLFDLEESMFPIENIADRRLVDIALRNLGIISQYLPWSLLNERAQTVQDIYESDRVKALNRTQGIIQCIEYTSKYDPNKTVSHLLSKIPFLPVMPKPNGYPLPWYGKAHSLVCGTDVVLKDTSHSADVVNIAGSQIVILNTKSPAEGGCGVIHITACGILKIQTVPTISNAIKQLQSLVAIFELTDATPSDDIFEWCDEICDEIYDFLTNQLHFKVSKESEKMISKLVDDRSIWTGKSFISPQVVAKDWRHETGPYLFKLPSQLATKKDLINLLGIKERFTLNDIVSALNRMKTDFEGKPVEQPVRAVLFSMIHEIDHIMAYTEGSNIGMIMLPDTTFVMHHACELSYNDAPWCKLDEKYTLVNVKVNRDLALRLGVRPVRSNMLDKYAFKFPCLGTEFGQREELTRRIQNIIREYPFDITVLKELLQNADDAKANKMWVILDKRVHTGEGILSEHWNHLQGPALLVWNDSIFSEKDLDGIQSLGLGSKRSESESIGQYGIGFNVVYHLTDCPSFITDGKTLCVFDPHCRYVDGADQLSPGRRIDVTSGFWNDFPGMKSPFLRKGLHKLPPELTKGSLFRFPLRHTTNHIKDSKILDHSQSPSPLTADKMHDKLKEWVPDMKKALLFLNNVIELKFLVIEKADTSLQVECAFQVTLNDQAVNSREIVQTAVNAFTQKSGSRTCVERYCLTTTESHSDSKSQNNTECWLIQQGVGDICDQTIHWEYISQVKPRHGIAVLLQEEGKNSQSELAGEVFCFLPLPIQSNLPVHVNGHFVLDASRRALWKSTQPDHVDGRAMWNKNLLNAISSSYANLLIHAHAYIISQQPAKPNVLSSKLSHYYDIFPCISGSGTTNPEGIWRKVAEDVYKKLANWNAPVLAAIIDASEPAVISQTDITPSDQPKPSTNHFRVKLHRIHCSDDPSSQIHFFRVSDGVPERNMLKMILQRIGMIITSAPLRIKHRFDSVKVKIPATDPDVVFKFYITYCCLQESTCHIKSTPFQTVSNFERFSKYILRKCEVTEWSASSVNCYEFYEKPDGYYLLLTADCMLRRFTKVIQSPHCSLFDQSQDMFLHPDLLKLKLKRDMFWSADDSDQDFSIVHGILSKSLLLQSVKTRKVQNAASYLKYEKLKELWACFETDPVFLAQLNNILKRWALLLTTQNELFSCPTKECLLPIVKSSSSDPMYHVLQQLGMPILASGVITDDISNRFCPTLQNYAWILHDISFLHQEHGIASLLSHDILETLLDYLRNINFRSNSKDMNVLRSLPVFESIDGELTPLSDNTAYIWPHNVCSVGRNKWLQGQKVIFLNPRGLWSKIGSGNDIEIHTISAEELYVTYIFPVFHKMTEEERYEHLCHFRDNLLSRAELNSTSRDCSIMQYAKLFVSVLKTLPCVRATDNTLKCISDFYDHRQEIFTAFPHHFHFLPEKFCKESNERKWMDFFCKLGLKQSVTANMYLELCNAVAHGQQDTKKNSSILLRYLLPVGTKYYPSKWHQDQHFLSQVSQIKFVFVEPVPELTWIKSRSSTESQTTLRNAADIQHKTLLWTVRPIIELPTNSSVYYPKVLQSLGIITTPLPLDVVANISNLSKSKFADLTLFDNFPVECSKPDLRTHTSILQALLSNYSYLCNHSTSASILQLSNCQCIPVHADPKAVEEFKKTFIVLVRPICVLTTRDAEDYFPILHVLPDEMFGCVPLLEKIGVMRTLTLEHFSTVLKTAFDQSSGLKLEPNMNTTVKRAVKKMHRFLQDNHNMPDDEITTALLPLYLPTTEGKLCLSSSLLYRDSNLYENITVDLSGTEMQILHVPHESYGFVEGDFCLLLPEVIRPKRMSQCCIQEISPECTEAQQSQLATSLLETLSLPSLPKLLMLFVGQITKDDDLRIKFQPIMETFLKNFCIQTIHKLRTNIQLTAVMPHRFIGSANVDLHVLAESDDHCFTLCIDSGLAPSMRMLPIHLIAHHLIVQVTHLSTTAENTTLNVLERAFENALQGESHNDHSRMLNSVLGPGFNLDTTDIVFEADIQPRLGKSVPQTWHHRLDQDINNLFHSEEWVGYEDEKGDIIFAQVVCPVIPVGVEKLCAFLMKYKILVGEEDEDSIEVSSLRIFKFMKGRRHAKVEAYPEINPGIEAQSSELTLYEGTVTPECSTSNIDINDLKKELCHELKIIWTLQFNERKQAIKRLYLKWHPDKNPDMPDVAEEMFKYLQCQLDRLKKGLPLEDLDNSGGAHTSSRESGGGSSYSSNSSHFDWSSYFREWNRTAHQHSRYSYSEANFQERYYGRGGGSSRGGGERRGGGGGTHGCGWWGGGMGGSYFFDSEEDFTRPKANPAEGERWLRQATDDYEMLCVNHCQMSAGTTSKLASYVCFLAHQVAEKALKGGKYIVCGLGDKGLKSHSLTDHAYALQVEKPHQLQSLPALTAPLEMYYLNTRYPNLVPAPQIPSERYTVAEADEAKMNAKKVLEMMRGLIL